MKQYRRGPNPVVRISARKNFPPGFYEDMLISMLLKSSRYDIGVDGMGVKIRDAVEVVCKVAKKTEGTFIFRYGEVKITEKEQEDFRRKAIINIPCRNLRSEMNGYHKVRKLDSDPWEKNNACYDQNSNETVLYMFNLLREGGHGCLIGHDDNIINCVRHFISTTSRAQYIKVENLEIELGYKNDESFHSGIKIEMDVKKVKKS